MTDEVHAVVIDTDAFSHLYLRQEHGASTKVQRCRQALKGWRVVIAFQTRAEVLAGAHIANWGEKRLVQARELLDRTPTVPPDNKVIDAYAHLTARCKEVGHALHDKQHTGDRWIAACALVHDLPVLSWDGIFSGVPGLRRFSA